VYNEEEEAEEEEDDGDGDGDGDDYEEKEECDERELGVEDPRYVAETALLQELYFPQVEKAALPDDASERISFSLSLSPAFLSLSIH
jgi:hypothetical protein